MNCKCWGAWAAAVLVAGCCAVLVWRELPTRSLAAPSSSGPWEREIVDFAPLSAADDWPWWRGPTRNGIAPATATAPIKWSETENIAWKSPIPGRGHCSPIIVGDQVILTTADEAAQTQSVLAYDRRTGRLRWQTEVNRGGFAATIHRKNTHATPTPACDGRQLYVSFNHDEAVHLTALDLQGKVNWRREAGRFHPRAFEYGYAPSPVLYRSLVIVVAESDDGRFLAALDQATGKDVWRTDREVIISFSTPSLAHLAGRDQLLMSGGGRVDSYDPPSGKPLWSVPGTTAATCGTAVWDGDIVFASGGYPKPETIAIRAAGGGEVLWTNKQKCYEQSMLATDGHLYALTGGGVLFCWRARDGQEMWKERLRGPVSASPVLVGGHIYWSNELGTTYVFRPNPERAEIVAENHLGDDSFPSPAVSHGQLFLRVGHGQGAERRETLYCIGPRATP